MKKINIKYVDFWPGFKPSDDFMYSILSEIKEYDVNLSENPDYIIYSCFGKEHLKYDCVRIFYTGEEMCPDFNICDYGIGFEYLSFGDRYFRLPLMYEPLYIKDYKAMMKREYTDQSKRKFCSFVYSNNAEGSIRNDFFIELTNYKEVASGGKYLNNVGGPVEDKRIFESGYKFSIAFENVSHPGYITEKLMQAFAAGGIPIYWGDPCVSKMFNKKSFINIGDFENIEKAISYIKTIDRDDNLYKRMIEEPPLLDEYLLENVKKRYEKFIRGIFDQKIGDAKRTTRKAYNANYIDDQRRRERILKKTAPLRNIISKFK